MYVSSTASQPAANRGKSTCKVTIINTNKHSYHLISNDGGKVYGWVDKANVQTKSSTTTKATTSKSTKQVTSGDNKAVYHTVKKGNAVWGPVSYTHLDKNERFNNLLDEILGDDLISDVKFVGAVNRWQ